MKIVIKFTPEIIIKSRSVRIFFIKVLIKNIQIIFKKNVISVSVIRYWDYLEVQCENNNYLRISQILMKIPGIHHFLLVYDSVVNTLEDIYYQINLTNYTKRLSGKTFCVRVKRCGNHNFTSQDVECYLGKKLCDSINGTRIKLTNPDEILFLEIKHNRLFIVINRYEGLGGFPIGTQQSSLSLISGGFDSSVASYMLIKRGCKIHYCFFNLGGVRHAIEVYRIVYYLWSEFSCSHKVKLISIDFSGVVKEILSKIKCDYTGVILKRMMIRAASIIASRWNIKALVTGEVLGQVSSQTLENMVLIDSVLLDNCIILRPLIVYDKETIIKLARKIGTEVFSKTVLEYCGVISKKSTTVARKEYVELSENSFNYAVLDQAILDAHVIDVHKLSNYIENQQLCKVTTQTELNEKDIMLDIRTESEQENNPIQVSSNVIVKKIPFYKLIDQFPKLDQNKIYVLYCDRGVMSKLQAIYLYQQGFRNVRVYKSITN